MWQAPGVMIDDLLFPRRDADSSSGAAGRGGGVNAPRQRPAHSPARFYPDLDDEVIEILKRGDIFRPRSFRAGEWIAEPGRPLTAAYFVESGLVSATDDAAVDFIWPGIVFDAGSTFGEYTLVEGGSPFPSTLRALTDVETFFVSPEYFRKALTDPRCSALQAMVEQRVKLDRLLPDVVKALNRYPPTEQIPTTRLVELARTAEVLEVPHDVSSVLNDGDWVFVSRGEIQCSGLRIPEGSTFIFHEWARSLAASASRDGINVPQIVRLPREMREHAAAGSFHVRQALNAVGLVADRPVPSSERVGFVSGGRGPTARAIALFLAQTLHRLPNTRVNRVGVLLIATEEVGLADASPALRELEGDGIQIAWASPNEARRKLDQMDVDLVVLDTSHAPEDFVSTEVQELVTRAVVLNQGLLDEVSCKLRGAQLVRAVMLGQVSPGDYLAYRPGTVRLAFDNPDRLQHCSFEQLSTRDKKSLERLARAVLEMRVGVALGGGGSWGYAHVALLEELERANVPIDILSGVSFGSLAAGFYAAGGSQAMRKLVDQGLIFQLYLVASGLTPLPGLSQHYIDMCLGNKRLEYLDTPFFPVGLDLVGGAEWSYGTGTVGFGIRAASALPGLLPPLVDVAKQIRSIDGCYINNVPEGVLIREGADFVIASDVVQAPPRTRESRWTQIVSDIWPVSRMNDNMRGLATLAKIGNERDAEYANLTFRPPASGASVLDFRKADAIVEGARGAAQSFAATAAEKYWGSMSLKRG
jgi:predicted acylesterase/phospholipase RssA/CRP-like cAMP-binding protein